jgi:cytochrome c
MRPPARLASGLAVAALAAWTAVLAQEKREDLTPADQKAAAAAEDEALRLGQKVFNDASLGTAERACAKCHNNPNKPELSLKGINAKFPRWDRQASKVITLQEKFVQMQERSLKAQKTLPLGDARWTALEIYVRSLK